METFVSARRLEDNQEYTESVIFKKCLLQLQIRKCCHSGTLMRDNIRKSNYLQQMRSTAVLKQTVLLNHWEQRTHMLLFISQLGKSIYSLHNVVITPNAHTHCKAE